MAERARLAAVGVLVLGALAFRALDGATLASFTAGVTNTTSSATAGTMYFRSLDPLGNTCTTQPAAGTAIDATARVTCPGGILPSTVPTSGTATNAGGLRPTITDTATTSPTTATLQAQGCGAAGVVNGVQSLDPMLVRNGISYGVAGPLTGSGGLGLNGTNAYSSNVLASVYGTSFTAAIWFRTTTGGVLLSLGDSSYNADAAAPDRVLYVTAAGVPTFNQKLGTGRESATGPGGAANGAWHLAVVTAQPGLLGLLGESVTVSLDGVAGTTVTMGLIAGGGGTNTYVRLGYGNLTGISTTSSNYLTGAVSDAALFNNATPSASTLHAQTSQSGYAAAVQAANPTDFWPLGDTAGTLFTGPFPYPATVVATTSPCSMVDVTVATQAGVCVYPTSGCAATSSSATLWSLFTTAPVTTPAATPRAALTLPPSAIGAPQSIVTQQARDTTYSAYIGGLHLLLPVAVTESAGAWSDVLTYQPSDETVVAP